MRGSLGPILLTIAGAVLYHASSKSVPRAVHPLAAILAAYLAAIGICLLAAWWWPDRASFAGSIAHFNWGVVGIGAGAALIEVGFLLAYRAGWPLNVASMLVNVSAALLLIPLGFALFAERISPTKALGITFCLLGLFLISRD